MIYKFFKDVKSIEELKSQYKKLAFQHHPDRGGNTADMQQINNEYDELLKRVKNVHATVDGKTYTKADEPADVPDNFRKIINAIISFIGNRTLKKLNRIFKQLPRGAVQPFSGNQFRKLPFADYNQPRTAVL